jgi:formate hydrogenlyase subunit 3/multisubunit Na+/H+ antiporter MnhD subunit
VTDPILLFSCADAVALLLLGAFGALLPRSIAGFATIGLSGLGALLCLPPLLSNAAASVLELPIGPPGLSLHLVLDPVSALFLLVTFICGTTVAAFWAIGEPRKGTSWINEPAAGTSQEIPSIPLCLGGVSVLLLAADAVTLAVGAALASAAFSLTDSTPPSAGASPPGGAASPPAASQPNRASWPWATFPAFLLLISVCLLTPSGFAPRFDAIRAASVDPSRAMAAAALTVVSGLAILRCRSTRRQWALDALTAGAVLPSVSYLLIRLVIDLPGAAAQGWWGFVLLLVGAEASITYGWRAAQHPDLDGSVACLMRRQVGLAIIGLGLTLIARSADLPDAASFGLAASLLLTITSGVAGTLASLAAHALGLGAGSYRMVRLGGLVQSMPIASMSLAASLLALSVLPPGAGFAALWLLFQTILLAPRTGGLISQLPLALAAAAVALSSALATAASVRLIGITLLSRPRSVRGSAATDVTSGLRPILLTMSGISVLLGAVPGLALKIFAEPTIWILTGIGLGSRAGWATLSASSTSPGYSALPVLASLLLAIGSVMLVVRRAHRESRLVSAWNEGLAPSPGLPFGDPLTQSAGEGFLPTLSTFGPPGTGGSPATGPAARDPVVAGPPHSSLRLLSRVRTFSARPLPSAGIGLWAILFAFSAVLLLLSWFDGGGAPG